ncbi:MAG: hypothetical protein HOI53_03905, partial [Francisellaceae bacterium]|nr:hypothetical protein [Francisellaceae bacterium]
MENKIDNLEVSTLLEEQDPNKHIRTLATIISVIVIIAIIWASVTTIDELTKAPGVIKPSGQSQIIKHIEGGKVKTVLKTNGDFVV